MDFPLQRALFISNNSYLRIGRHALYWLIYVFFFSIIWGTYDHDYLRNLMIQLYGLPARMILVYVSLFYIFPIFLKKKNYLHFLSSYALLLLTVSLCIQRPMMLYHVQPIYLPQWDNQDFLALTEIMNTLLDVNLAAIIPIGYAFFRVWQQSEHKTQELEKKSEPGADEKFIYLKVEKSLQKIAISEILFIESLGNYVKVKTRDREIIAYKSIASLAESLPEAHFLRVHRSFIVRIGCIDAFSPSKIEICGSTIPVGRKYKEEVKQTLGYF